MLRRCLLFGSIVLTTVVATGTPPGQPDERWNRLFQPETGWIGGDGGSSAAAGPNRTAWIFSDTFVGDVREGRRTNATMVNNTAAISCGTGPDAAVEFFVRRDAEGKPAALIVPDDGQGFFWIHSAVAVNERIVLFLVQIEKTGDGAFDFGEIGRWLGVVDNPRDSPLDWIIRQIRIPFSLIDPQRLIGFGAATLVDDGFLYIYGVDEHRDPRGRGLDRFLVAARAPVTDVETFSEWSFLEDSRWQDDFQKVTPLAADVASEDSVVRVPGRDRYALVYSHRGMSREVHVRTAASPAGPFSDPAVVFVCPEMDWDRRNFCYGAKAHPTLSTQEGMVFTYFTNSADFWHVAGDARLYWPRFVRVPWSALP